ncbi:MAG: winged helix-turn-helix transcriptional regulator [Thermoplasmatota archaeon]
MKRERGNRSETREELHHFILDNPGVTFGRLSKVFGLNRGTLRYHLDYLEGEEKVRRVRKGNRNCYFSESLGAPGRTRTEEMLGAKHRRLLSAIKDNPGISRKELIRLTDLTREDLNYGLRKLKDRKVIWKTADGGDPCYEYISREKLAAEMMLIILEKFLDDEIDKETFLLLKSRLQAEMDG